VTSLGSTGRSFACAHVELGKADKIICVTVELANRVQEDSDISLG
jgi:hypothetical protein